LSKLQSLSATQSPVRRRGLMLVLSSPSGAGKSTIARAVLAGEPQLTMSVSVTTRPPRTGEVDGQDYWFVDAAAFQRMVSEQKLLEHAEVFGNCYGTPREPVEAALQAGRDVLFDVDWQGAQQLRDSAPRDVVAVFILPPSLKELERRLSDRGQDSADVVERRMAQAADEISHWEDYDYVVINESIDQAIAEVRAVLVAERHRRNRMIGLPGMIAAISQR